jgi:hypothetical protein
MPASWYYSLFSRCGSGLRLSKFSTEMDWQMRHCYLASSFFWPLTILFIPLRVYKGCNLLSSTAQHFLRNLLGVYELFLLHLHLLCLHVCGLNLNKDRMWYYRGAAKSLALPDWKKQLKGRHFSSDSEVISAAVTWLDGQPSELFLSGLQKLVWSLYLVGGLRTYQHPGICTGLFAVPHLTYFKF